MAEVNGYNNNKTNIDSNKELTDSQLELKQKARIHKILQKLFDMYSNSEAFKVKFKSKGYEDRSLLLTVVKEPIQGIDIHEVALTSYNSVDAVRFGAIFSNQKLQKYSPANLTDFTVQCLMDQDVFIDLLVGKDKYGEIFDINDAWGRKWIGFEGKDWLIHKEI